MNPSSGKAILDCPSCGMPLVNIGSRVERIHPLPRFIERRYYTIILLWGFSSIILLGILNAFLAISTKRNELGMLGLVVILAPAFLMRVLKCSFPLYRITDCPFCGHHEKLNLGRSSIG